MAHTIGTRLFTTSLTKSFRTRMLVAAVGLAATLASQAMAQTPLGTSFTYQGELRSSGSPANGVYDLEFRLSDSANLGLQVGVTLISNDINVVDGRFTVTLDFGDQYNGDSRWLNIAVRPGASVGAYTNLSPRQPLASTPYAQGLQLPLIQSQNLASGALMNLTNASANNSSGVLRLTSGAPSGNALGVTFQPVLVADTNDGNGIISYNSSSGAYAFYGRTEGTSGNTFVADNLSNAGRAGWFEINNATNVSSALDASTNGTGSASEFAITNSASAANALESRTTGTGSSAFFDNNNAAATKPTLDVESSSGGASIPSASQDAGIAIKGESTGSFSIGVMGRGVSNGVFGYCATTGGAGVLGRTGGSGGSVSTGVRGEGNGAGTSAIAAFNNFGNGIYALAQSGTAIFADNGGSNTTGYAGDFNGRVRVQGNLQVTGSVSKGSGTFMIDHPLDPENKFLYHSFVESPDMKNIYDGVVIMDKNGHATVSLPEYFEALNKDYRYQLTCIGGYAPVFIAKEVSSNQFEIAGGSPGLKVSWTITGIRQDPYANANRVVPEVMKGNDERGLYLYPEVYGKPDSLRMGGSSHTGMKVEILNDKAIAAPLTNSKAN